MPEFLMHFDQTLFHLINTGIANPLFDVVMPFITDVKHFIPVYILLIGFLLWKGGSEGRWAALLLLVSIGIADPLNSRVLKEQIARERPCRELSDVRLLVNCGGGKSFPSSHAVNNFAALVIFFWFFRRYAWIWFVFAALISFSRIYVGVHYPLDILGGALIGILIGAIVIALFELIRRKGKPAEHDHEFKGL